MPASLACLVGFVAWTAFLALAIVAIRCSLVLAGRQPSTAFPADQAHGGPRYQRLLRAHANCVENLPLFAAVALVAAVQAVALPAVSAYIYLGARVLQSCSHIASGGSVATKLRLVFFLTQVGCLLLMLTALLAHL